MTQSINLLEPRLLWQHFHNLTQIPRPSHHEHEAQQYVLDFAAAKGLSAERDQAGNVIVRKPPSKGMESKRGVILQGHLDMVPQANSDVSHDFTRDPIRTRIDGEWVKSIDTTLGADNGIGVAAALAVLESRELKHGPLEALFTSNEEDGMGGAFGLKPGSLEGDILLNMDSEDEGVFSICCAGGANVNTRMALEREAPRERPSYHRVAITGLKGGHSGVDIHLGRGNANRLLFRFLRAAAEQCSARLVDVQGGSLRNAIPREAFADIAVPESAVSQLQRVLDSFTRQALAELGQVEPRLSVSLTPLETAGDVIDRNIQRRLIHSVCANPHGVVRMSDSMPGLVETSNNLAVVRFDGGYAEILNLVRSSLTDSINDLCLTIKGLYDLSGAESTIDGAYPGWQPDMNSAILGVMQTAYRYCFDEEARVEGIHAGLECGILGASNPHWDMISFGPTIRFPHSPDERVHIRSVGRFWQLLVKTLAEIPEA